MSGGISRHYLLINLSNLVLCSILERHVGRLLVERKGVCMVCI